MTHSEHSVPCRILFRCENLFTHAGTTGLERVEATYRREPEGGNCVQVAFPVSEL